MTGAEASGDLLILVAMIVGLGVLSQLLSARFRVPSVLFLITAGVAIGPEGLGVLTIDSFGESGLSTIVGLSVAIIVFEGAFHLKAEKIREAPAAVIRLTTVGAAIAFLGTAGAVRFFLGANWDIALLIGALLVATGPTVITPILKVVPVRDRVAATLETEGIVNDVTAAILAVVLFKSMTVREIHADVYLQLFAERLGTGLLVGVVVAAVVWAVLQYVDISPDDAPRNARLLTLAGAIVAFGTADYVFAEAGVAAAATAGLILGNANLPYEEEIEAFKGDITLLVLSFVFITLAALLEFDQLFALGLGGVAVVVAVMLVLRPFLVFLSTRGGRFTFRERLFMSAVGPRGIIPASVATLFAIRLQTDAAPTNPAGADLLVGTVFLVILVTVVLEGGLARQIAETLDVIPMRVLIIGGGRVGRSLAERLEARGENVVLIEADKTVLEELRNDGFTAREGDGTDTEVLREAGVENAKTVVAASGDDDVNLLVAQLAKSNFDVENVIARANNPSNASAFEDLGVQTISAAESTAWAIDNRIERPALSDWMSELGRSGDVQEIEITDEDLVGQRIVDVGGELPNGVLIALVSRNGASEVPTPDVELQAGDHITLIGRTEAVQEAINQCGKPV
ncbi:TrkA-N domain protein [Natrinema pellirubrum DSM 15624]|uniref:NhaP-type Na+(K+)/H+ antiporter n=1 Tax=Natrinema pellirubrum (strain DSM 15624 / CIP 106293 / JCM 10476 / NCIMB 786 / 157) TaxID=797303 RepID=L0JRX8_NATP1|nr:cation:proton antiporter [Natrinema pellirubrum]AGB33367.1 NhaP-type Na+(K+)/H+ antiporter [Natrinema pellirubrum DSM 15624]ELY71195.1 TrkA-N domain protein [Natrinema pellirubrum DSM 15624]